MGLKLPLARRARLLGDGATAPATARPITAPRAALMDERYKVAISRLGKRVRVAGSAETRRLAGQA